MAVCLYDTSHESEHQPYLINHTYLKGITMNEKITQIKTHVVKHKVVYIVAGATVGAVALLGIGYAVGTKAVPLTVNADIVANTEQKPTGIFINSQVTQYVYNHVERSCLSKPLRLVATNETFDSINEAARKTGHLKSLISQNANGLIPDVKGDVFEFLMKVE